MGGGREENPTPQRMKLGDWAVMPNSTNGGQNKCGENEKGEMGKSR